MKKNLFIRRTIVSILGAALILLLGYWLMDTLGSREPEVRQMSFREAAKKVEVAPVVYKSREIALSGLGKVVSESAIDLIAEVQGEILAGNVLLKRGTSFRKGQTLFRIDNREARLSLYAQKSNFMTSIASVLPDLRIDFAEAYPRWQSYFESLTVEERLPDLPEMKTAKEKVFFTSRDILNQFYNIQSAEARLAKYVVRAPFSGSIVEVVQEVNSVINPGGRVARIARSNRLELEVPFQTSDLEYVKRGMQVEVLSEDRSNSWKGKISRIGKSLDAATQTINLYISFNPGATTIFEGQFLMAEIPGSKVRNVMEIPRNAVFNRNQIYLVADSSRLVSTQIEIEKINQESVLFTGVASGELIVTQPLLNAYDNMPVQVMDEM
ncbi:MAG: efflux RND transporter periplasmic adaptor subunit [Bacteroidota bacterium]